MKKIGEIQEIDVYDIMDNFSLYLQDVIYIINDFKKCINDILHI